MKASRTAVLVCQGRAAAHGRIASDRFADPLAITMLREDERVPVEQVRAGTPPTGWAQRLDYESVRACAELIVPRTIAIDDALCTNPLPQLVILGAGLDGRAWRMAGLADVDVFEVDHPMSQEEKRDRIGDSPMLAKSLRFVPVDFAHGNLGAALTKAGYCSTTPTAWIWEGVVPYLDRKAVVATVATVGTLSAGGSRLIVNYQSPSLRALFGRVMAAAMNAPARRRTVWAQEPRRSAWKPEGMRRLLAAHGFAVVNDDTLLTVADRLSLPARQRISLRAGRVAVAETS